MITTFDKAIATFVSALFMALAARYPILDGWGPVVDALVIIALGLMAGGLTWLVPNKSVPPPAPDRDPQDEGAP
jgi:CHASE2 domain-containing sensor protein